ncbi:chemotaxis protein CheB [Eionea flava]
MSVLTIGIVSETLVQQHYLKHAAEEMGCVLGGSFLVNELSTEKTRSKIECADINAWIVDIDIERLGDDAEPFEQWLYALDSPIIFSEGNTYNAAGADFVSWTRQLKAKLLGLAGQHHIEQTDQIRAKYIWVLAASTGGPEAVKAFLDTMPHTLDVAFIYVQHIGEGHSQALSQSIVRDNQYIGRVAAHGDVLVAGHVFIIPPEHQMTLQPNGSFVAHPQKKWRGIYTPSVDHVVASVASNYQQSAGVIFFTGMGDDGVKSCRLMKLHGGQSWVQALPSCVATSMPEAIIKVGCSTKMDSPENLARHLKAHILQTAS